jgi:hypothetical protein
MYADDLILLAPSVAELQLMLDICTRELNDVDLRLNVSKSSCIRIGKRCYAECKPIVTADGIIPWSSTVKYLGINIVAGMKFSCNIDNLKSNFYSSFNAIYCKLGMINNPIVTLHLTSTIALPCLTYAQEALSLNKTYLKSLEHPWSRVFMKLFTTYNENVIHQCQYFTDCMPLEHSIFLKKFNFLNALKFSPNWMLVSLFELTAVHELKHIYDHYGLNPNIELSYYGMKQAIYSYFKNKLNL